MSKIRKAHSVEIIDRRLRNAEAGGVVDAMELVGLQDELARVERKWLEKWNGRDAGRPTIRPLADAAQLNQRFERLARLVDASLRSALSPAERPLLERTQNALRGRAPLPV